MKRSVQIVNSALLALALVSPAWASPETCSPVFLANPQGRPLANTVVTITNLDGSAIATPIWTNQEGTVAFQGIMPASQVLQVYIEAGVYKVFVSGEGLTKTFQIVCSIGVGSNEVSIDRTADLLLRSTDSPPTLECNNNVPCDLAYDPNVVQFAVFDFMMPSGFPLTFTSALLTWHPFVASTGNVVWSLNWCTYSVGQPPCDPSAAAHKQVKISSGTGVGNMNRIDVTWDSTLVAAGAWAEGTHVVVAVSREADDPADTWPTLPRFENIQLEFER